MKGSGSAKWMYVMVASTMPISEGLSMKESCVRERGGDGVFSTIEMAWLCLMDGG